MRMKNKAKFVVVIVIVIVLILNSLIEGKIGRQGDAIDKLYKAKFLKRFSLKEEENPVPDNPIPDQNQFMNPNQNSGAWKNDQNAKENDRIEKLPGQPNVNFEQYGGYITVDPVAGRAFYYYFVQSEKPQPYLFLWLNGGPGCSSLAYGAMHEIGPFRVESDRRTLYYNKYSWNRFANILFVESPARVGFSYSNTTSDYARFGDTLTAKDNYMFIVKWLERFPEYKDTKFYIGGESYAGHYVPQLANLILQQNKIPNSPFINLKGILVGNPALNLVTDVTGMFDYFAGHGLCSVDNINDVKTLCKFTAKRDNDSLPCINAIYRTYVNTDDIDIYSIFAPTCKSEAQAAYSKDKPASVDIIDPCSVFYVFRYMNHEDVQAALHANTTNLQYPWEPCNDDILSLWTDKPDSVLPVLRQLMNKGLKMWFFSGDQDAKIPLLATQYSLKLLDLTIKKEWYPWIIAGEVGGYAEEYNENVTFATVRGAGHEVPYYQPKRALHLFQCFLSGSPLPSKVPKATPVPKH